MSTLQFVNGTRDRGIFLWKLEGKELQPLGSFQLATSVPRNIGFLDVLGDECYVFGAYNGQWYAVAFESGLCLPVPGNRHIVKASEKQVVFTHDLNKAM
jgi:hypothetical protein